MKKQFLILFAFISVLALSQVPQRFNKVIVTGDITSPKFIKTGSTVDSVLLGNGSARSVNSLKTDTISLSNRINTKEPLLPSTPPNPESRFLNGNKQWAEIVLGSGGYASNVYFTNLTSTIVGSYKQTSGTHELTETIASGTCNNNEVLIHTYLFEQPVGITTVDAGVWRFTMNCAINSNVGDSKFKIVQFRRSSAGVETDMFTIYSNTIENTDYQNFIIETVQPSFLVDSLDRFGCRIYATTTTTVNKTISYKVGDGFASYLNTPLALRHPQLRDPNGNPNVQHLTAAQVTKVNNTSGTNTGDETLTSIKTKLGAASSVSDGYLTYNMFNIFNGKEPPFTKNTGFNKNFGTTTGTVLEGRTFGTAANSAVGDFIQNQNSYAQSANTWIGGLTQSNGVQVNGRSGEPSSIGSIAYLGYNSSDITTRLLFGDGTGYKFSISKKNAGITTDLFTLQDNGAAAFVSTVNAPDYLLNGNNLFSSLSANYIPKWNGSSFINATAGTDYQKPITLTTNGTSGAATFENGVMNVPNYSSTGTGGTYACTLTNIANLNVGTATGYYTKVGDITSVGARGGCTTTAVGECTVRISMPTASTSLWVITANVVSYTGPTVIPSRISQSGQNYIDLTFNSSASGASIAFNVTGMCK